MGKIVGTLLPFLLIQRLIGNLFFSYKELDIDQSKCLLKNLVDYHGMYCIFMLRNHMALLRGNKADKLGLTLPCHSIIFYYL
jgi:hypothetical protein